MRVSFAGPSTAMSSQPVSWPWTSRNAGAHSKSPLASAGDETASVAAITAMKGLSNGLKNTFNNVSNNLKAS